MKDPKGSRAYVDHEDQDGLEFSPRWFCLKLHEKLKEEFLMLLLRQSKNNLPYDNVLELERVDHGYQEKGLRICQRVTYPRKVG